ncbi:LysR family transcriptional regulator [Pistricoccus aurantiacus]|uniref:LysR family transcriptional regulator n=1 Tax=Pistricoccus aurantiacus TaxID=1883414 RepID=A0A5B8SQ92_9GAMM|nr:LysR substrate-binding domain-containing protein [Pistricoccus aurantiacus]QEA38896.1 LysR family transcriptional regulator [Pistricoccus aurantiacus]
MFSLPPLLWMQAFESAARTLSFTAAGLELGVSQAAISQRIRLLEDRLGQKLFVRHPRSLSLTPAGQAWLPSLQEAFARLDEGTREVFGGVTEALVTLRATPMIQQNWLALRLPGFQHAYPAISLRLISAIWPGDFGPEGADLEIRYGHGDWDGVEAVSLGEETMLPVCAPALAETIHKPEDMAGQTLLHAPGFAVGWPTWWERIGLPGFESCCAALSCDSQMMTLALAARNGGIALSHHRLLEQRDDLVAPLDLAVASDESFWLVRPKRGQPHQEASRLWDWLVEHC